MTILQFLGRPWVWGVRTLCPKIGKEKRTVGTFSLATFKSPWQEVFKTTPNIARKMTLADLITVQSLGEIGVFRRRQTPTSARDYISSSVL